MRIPATSCIFQVYRLYTYRIPQISHPIAEKSYIQRSCGEANCLPTVLSFFVSRRASYTTVSTTKTHDKRMLL